MPTPPQIHPFPDVLARPLRDVLNALKTLEEANTGGTFPRRRFTLDGHFIGSLGEAVAAIEYGVVLYPTSHASGDGELDGRIVEIKATQVDRIALRDARSEVLDLLVIRFHLTLSDPGWELVYYGELAGIRSSLGPRSQRNGQASVSLARLRTLDSRTPPRALSARL